MNQNVAFPRYNLARVFTLRDLLANDVLTDFCGFAPSGEHFEELVDRITKTLGRVTRRVVWDSVRDVAGQLLLDDDIYRMSWRLAGNLTLLRSGTAVPPWHVQQQSEWVPVQIIAYAPSTSSRGAIGGDFALRVLAGTSCPIRIIRFFSGGFARVLATRLGYSTKRRGRYKLGSISELVGLRMWIGVEPHLCKPGKPDFEQVGCSAGLRNWNLSVIKKRFRIGWQCPHDYDHYCYQCHVGYLDCPAATHRETMDVSTSEPAEDTDSNITIYDTGDPAVTESTDNGQAQS